MKKILSLVLSLLLLGSFSIPAMALEQSSEPTFDTALYYPIVDTEEWVEMERDERVNACQIPDESLSEMPTDDLLQTVLEYPFMIDLYAFDTYADGFEHVYSEFPALEELAEREDFGAVLVDFYQSTPVANRANARNSLDYESIKNLSLIEILLAQPEMTYNLEETEIDSLISIAEEKYLEKSDTMTVNGGNLTTFYEALDENPDSVIARATNSTVSTPNGSSVTVYNCSTIVDWTASEKASLNAQYDAAYPMATRLRDPSKKYNCHSYAWYSTSASNYYWMENPSPYMTDGSYASTTSSSTGNKVYWQDSILAGPIHSGILALNSGGSPFISCNSKWGQLGLYNHTLNDCPYSGTRSYWTR